MKSSSRIAINTAASYTRSLLGVGLALFSSRWILQALGATDFGLFQVVGSLIVFLSFFNSVMANSAARHFAFAIGKGDTEDVNRWFNTSLSIHLILPSVLIAIGWPGAEYAIRNWLTIPPERVDACVTVFRISLIGAFVNMASIPFIAMFNAKQRITEASIWDMLQNIFVFALAWYLTRASSDRLIFYAMGMVGTHVVIHSSKTIRALILFPECHIRPKTGFDFPRMKELLDFAGWTMIGISGGMLRNQGSSILLNVYFGPAVNAAYGIANQVSAQTNMLSGSLMNAISPEITTREGRGQRSEMIALSSQASKLGTYLALLMSIPLIMEAQYVLNLWLVTPPEHAVILCQLILLTFISDKLTAGYMFAVNAYGKIAYYQATVGVLLFLTLPLAWLLLILGMPPAAVGIAFVIMQSLCSIGRILWVKRLFDVGIKLWLSSVAIPCSIVSGFSVLAASLLIAFFEPSLQRLILVCCSTAFCMIIFGWLFGTNNKEKTFIKGAGKGLLAFLRPRK